MKKIIWMMISGLIVLTLILASCETETVDQVEEDETEDTVKITETETSTGPTETDEKTPEISSDVPRYGGTITLAGIGDVMEWDPVKNITGTTITNIYQQGWEGAWEKGPAGGYGTGETDWGFTNNDLFHLKDGRIYESWEWTIDEENKMGTIVYQIRQGVYYHETDTRAGRLVGGRQVTADDVVYCINRAVTIGPTGFIWRANPELHDAKAEKTGSWEVTVTVPLDGLITAISRFGDSLFYYPPDIVETYENMNEWSDAIGTGPFMLVDMIPSSIHRLKRNPNYWDTDPVGPGQGNQLPYVDQVKILIIPDASSRYAALRTGQIDDLNPLNWEDASQIINQCPDIMYKWSNSFQGRGSPLMMRIDKEELPYKDIKVRKAMIMSIDYNEILEGLYDGQGQIITWPFSDTKEYHELYLGLDDPMFPESAKENFTYNPEKAKQLLADAGYPDGFKATLMLTSSATPEIEYYQIIKEYWAKIGIDLEFDLRDPGAAFNLRNTRTHDELATWTTGPVSIFYVGNPVWAQSASNLSMIDDPIINELMAQVRLLAITDQIEAMKLFKKVAARGLEMAYVVPNVIGSYYDLWWPWLRNYSGELTVGYDNQTFTTWVWFDDTMKKSMGY